MFTEEENKIISLFYSADYELAEQLMIATNNGKLEKELKPLGVRLVLGR